jgi:hypothetical protein
VEVVPVDTEDIAVEIKEKSVVEGEEVTLPNGHIVKFCPVSYSVLFDAQSQVIDPLPPRVPHPNDPEKYIDNPHDPDYLNELREKELERTQATMNTLFLFGLELVSPPMPKDDEWIEKLVVNGSIDAEKAKGAGKVLKELWYKKYFVATPDVLLRLMKMTDVSEEGISQAREAFKSNS